MTMTKSITLMLLASSSILAGDFQTGNLSHLESAYSSKLEYCTELSNKPLTPIKDKPNLTTVECKNTILYFYLETMHTCSETSKKAFEAALKKSVNQFNDPVIEKRISNHISLIEDEKHMRINAKNMFLKLPKDTQSLLLNMEIATRPFNGINAEDVYCH